MAFAQAALCLVLGLQTLLCLHQPSHHHTLLVKDLIHPCKNNSLQDSVFASSGPSLCEQCWCSAISFASCACCTVSCEGDLHEWLQALGAEVIVTFEGTSESGAQFMTRQSYLPSEMHWGYVFAEIIYHAKEGDTEHTVDISR